ncbi:MAG TPA: hypothetical protein VF476_15255 [Chitinophagaceae bacterium]
MKMKSLQLLVFASALSLLFSCRKNAEPIDPTSKSPADDVTMKALASQLPALGPGFARAFGINNSGAIAGSATDPNGKIVAFVLKNDNAWYSDEEVRSNGLPVIRFSINDPGDIAGSKANGIGITPMLWRNGQAFELQTVPGQQYGEVFDMNNAGQMVGECLNGNYVTPTSMRASLFSLNGPAIDLGTLGGTRAVASGINENGQIVGGAETASGETHAFLYENNVMHDLGTLGGTFSNAIAINNRGEIVGRSSLANGIAHAFLYKDGVMTDLGTLGGATSAAFDINDKGEVVGLSVTSTGQPRGFLYKDGVMTDLGALGGLGSFAASINNKSEVVGYYTTLGGVVHGFIYRDGQMYSL